MTIFEKTYILPGKMYVFAFSEVCQKKHVFCMWFLGAAKKVCDPVCGLSGGPGRVGSGQVGPGRARVGPDRAPGR